MVSTLNFQLALANLPTLQLFAAPPPEVLGLVQSILEEFYTDGIDQVLSAELDKNGDIVGEFSDRVGARQVKRYGYRIKDSEVAYKLLNPNEVASFALESFKPLFGKGSRSGKKKNCTKSTPCGDSCISVGKMCRKKPGSAVAAKIAEAKAALRGKSQPAVVQAPLERVGQITQGIMLALPAAGQTSAPADKRNGPPLSPKEVQSAVFKKFGVSSASELRKDGMFSLATGGKNFKLKDPEEWKQIYRNIVGVLPDEVFEAGPKTINGVNLIKYNRPWAVFGLNPMADKYAVPKGLKGKEKKNAQEAANNALMADVKKAYKSLAIKHHPDVGGDPEVFAKLTLFKDSLTASF